MLSVLSLPQIQLHQSVTHKSAVRQGENITYNEAIHYIVIGIIFYQMSNTVKGFFAEVQYYTSKKKKNVFSLRKVKKEKKKRPSYYPNVLSDKTFGYCFSIRGNQFFLSNFVNEKCYSSITKRSSHKASSKHKNST